MSLLTFSAPAVKWQRIGQKVSGEIVDVEEKQETQFKTGALLYWGEKKGDGKVTTSTGPSGKELNPCMQLVVTASTGLNDPGVMNDNGERRIFMKGQMLAAMKLACRTHRIKDYDALIGAHVEVVFESEKPSDGGYDQKLFAVELTPAAPKAATNLLTGDDEDQGDAPAQPAETWVEKEKAKATKRTAPAAKKKDDEEIPF